MFSLSRASLTSAAARELQMSLHDVEWRLSVHQIDNCRFGGINDPYHLVHQNDICWHHPLIPALQQAIVTFLEIIGI